MIVTQEGRIEQLNFEIEVLKRRIEFLREYINIVCGINFELGVPDTDMNLKKLSARVNTYKSQINTLRMKIKLLSYLD